MDGRSRFANGSWAAAELELPDIDIPAIPRVTLIAGPLGFEFGSKASNPFEIGSKAVAVAPPCWYPDAEDMDPNGCDMEFIPPREELPIPDGPELALWNAANAFCPAFCCGGEGDAD